MQDRARGHRRDIDLQVLAGVPGERGYRVAGPDTEAPQCPGQPVDTPEAVLERIDVIGVLGTGHDELTPELSPRPAQRRQQRDRVAIHPEHLPSR